MKLISPQLAYLLTERETRRNLKALSKFLAVLVAVIAVFAVLFHVIMLHEGQRHTWVTGFYWTLTVMSTLGFGDITFHSDLGRLFSIVVLIVGVFMLLILLPFAFIRFFYAPWLEAQIRLRAPRQVPDGVEQHVIICTYDALARSLIQRLHALGTPYYVIESDVSRAASLHADGVSVVAGDFDNSATYRALRAAHAKLVFANLNDATNTNITITAREAASEVPIVAIVEDADSVDILELAGATHVLPLKHQLGEHLATRVSAGHLHAHVVGNYHDLVIAEFPVHNSPLAGRSIRDTRLRELTGLSVVAFWDHGELKPARADAVLGDYSVAVVVGTEDQVTALDAMFVIYAPNENPVLVVGGGKVGRATARALRQRGVTVHIVERDPVEAARAEEAADKIFVGDGNDRSLLMRAGLASAPSVVLSTRDDATNIYLAVYCRKLNPDLRIVSRITHERNMDAIHRAGADFVLSYSSLGAKSVVSRMLNRQVVILGESVDLFVIDVPKSLERETLAGSGIGAKTGLNVIAVQSGEDIVETSPGATTVLQPGQQIVVIGTTEQREQFAKSFSKRKRENGDG